MIAHKNDTVNAKLPKLLVLLGPTASGKSALSLNLAQKLGGEIVSADSRQVYRGLDIGSGKVTRPEQKLVPHHLLDVVNPLDEFSLALYQKLAFKAINDIASRGRLPLLVGGTALYIYAVVDNYKLSKTGPNLARRQELNQKSVEELQRILNNPSPLNNDDMQNPRLLIRAIEKLEAGQSLAPKKGQPKYHSTLLGIDIPRPELYQRIDTRVDERLKLGMIEEVENLIKQGVDPTWLISLGLEYRFITEYLQGKWEREQMIERLKTAIHAFSRRQMTWWKKDKRIIWIKKDG